MDGASTDTLIYDTTMAAHLRVSIDSSGEAALAGADTKSVGVTWQGESADARNAVRFNHNAGLQVMTASEAITVGDKVYAAASGKVATTGTILEGVAVTAADGDGSLVSVIPAAGVDESGPVFYAATATADGTGTGTIPDGARLQIVNVTSADANHIVVLPTPTPGTTIILTVGSNGFELRSSAPATVAISGGSGASAESAIPADTVAMLVCKDATNWLGWDLTGTTFAAIEAAA